MKNIQKSCQKAKTSFLGTEELLKQGVNIMKLIL